MNIEIEDEKAYQLAKQAEETKQKALVLQVRTPREFEQVSEFRKSIKAKFNEIDGHRKHLKEPYLEGCRRVDEFFRAPLQFLKEAESNAKKQLINYENEQERIAREKQRKLEAEARKKREALEAKARAEREKADREAAELRRKEEEARKANDLAAAVKLRHEAEKIVEKSEVKAETALSKASEIVAPKVEAYIPPVTGQYTKTIWKARVTDAKAVPDEYKIVDQKMLDAFAQATKGKVAMTGVEFYAEKVMVGKAK